MEISIFDSYCLHVHNLSFHLNNSQFSSLVYSIGWKCYLLFCWMIGLHIDIKKVCFRFNTKNFMQECFCIHAITKRRVDCISRHVWAMCITKSTWMVLCMCVCWFSRWILYCVMNRFRSLEQLHVEIQEHYDPMHIYNCNDKRYRATRIQKLYGLKKTISGNLLLILNYISSDDLLYSAWMEYRTQICTEFIQVYRPKRWSMCEKWNVNAMCSWIIFFFSFFSVFFFLVKYVFDSKCLKLQYKIETN